MSARKLGGGRILGSGKGLAPTPTALPGQTAPGIATAAHTAAAKPTSSTSSSGLRTSAAHAIRPLSPYHYPPSSDGSTGSNANLDITSIVFEDDASSSSATSHAGDHPNLQTSRSGSDVLLCPICQEEMLTLLQLNRHIDDNHQELPEVEQDEVRTWFDKQVLKAKRFQPLSLFAATQKLRGLEVFESNESSFAVVPAPASGVNTTANGQSRRNNHQVPTAAVDPDELITRKHWQRPTQRDCCTDPACGRTLGSLVGCINCRSCGKLFCEVHTMYQMKLSRAAVHEPVKGFWARVCETCYKSREGYNDHNGALTDHTSSFVLARQKRVDRQNIEITRLEKRLTRLTRLLADPPPDNVIIAMQQDENRDGVDAGAVAGVGVGVATVVPRALTSLGVNAFSTAQGRRKALEQSVVSWEDDKTVSRCPFCQQDFSWSFRRHHCRICGRVVCSDVQTSCSSQIPLTVAVPVHSVTEKADGMAVSDGSIDINIRMCRECKHTIFSKRDFLESITNKPPDQRAYETLRQFEKGIRLLMPAFHRALAPLQPYSSNDDDDEDDNEDVFQPPPLPPTHAQIQEASKIRKRLTDSFTKYDLAARRLRDLPTNGRQGQEKLQKAVYAAASAFLHTNMLPLKSLPRMLKSSPSSPGTTPLANGNHNSKQLEPSSLQYVNSLTSQSNGSIGRNNNNNNSNNNNNHKPGSGHDSGGSVTSSSETSTAGAVTTVSSADSMAGTLALEQEERDIREQLVVLEEQRFLVQQMIDTSHGQRRFEEVSALTRNKEELDSEITELQAKVRRIELQWDEVFGRQLGKATQSNGGSCRIR